jgi:S-layer homology domain.
LKSEPTQSVIAKTLKSNDDYDTDEDTDTVISGEFIVKDSYASGGVWSVSIVGVNADRFIESVKNTKVLNYTMDLKNPPSEVITTNITVSGKVFTELSRMGRTLTFATKDYSISFGAGALDFDTSGNSVYTNYVVALSSGITDSAQKPTNIDVKTKIGRVEVKSQQGTGYSIVSSFEKPALISYNLSDSSWFNEADSFGYVLDNKVWKNVLSQFKQDSLRGTDSLEFNAEKPCDFLVGQQSSAPYSDVLGNWANNYIKTLATKVNLKSVQGSYFKPDSYATIGDTVKMIFDVTGYNYSSNYLQEAYKAGLIDKNDAMSPNSYCTNEKALYMLMIMYERKSGEKLASNGTAANMFSDMSSVTGKYTERVYFAVENGIYSGKDKYSLNPTSNITRGELAAVLVKYLQFIGEV